MQRICSLTILAALAALLSGIGYAADLDPAKALAVLNSSAPPAEKALACKQLAICGKAEAVPALAALLPDRQLCSWARIALEVIPGEAAGAALREALEKLQGPQRLGVIGSLGVRRDAKAVGLLAARLKDADAELAAACALALGKISGEAAAEALEASLSTAAEAVRPAVAEGCIVCAERLAAAGKTAGALRLYRSVVQAQLPAQRVLEATRGLILLQGPAGLPLLQEQLQSAEKDRFALGLRVARELAGPEATQALLAELDRAPAARQGLLVQALADRGDKAALPAVLQLAKAGKAGARVAALRALKDLGDITCLPLLLAAAADADEAVAQAAVRVLAAIPGADIDKDLAGRLEQAEGKLRWALVEVAGRRPMIGVTAALCKAADDPDPVTRAAALKALGATIEFAALDLFVQRVARSRDTEEAVLADAALVAACLRMADREATSAKLVAAMSTAAVPVKCRFLEILTKVGGGGALAAVAAAAKDADPQIQDTGSRMLGEWADMDVAPVLLDLAKNAADKYKIRAIRGYIRLARQFDMPAAQRVEMCRTALALSARPDEKRLILQVINRTPGSAMLPLILEIGKVPQLKNEAAAVALQAAATSGGRQSQQQLRQLLKEMGHTLVKIEIIKAEYGAAGNLKDVTTMLSKHVHDFPVIVLPVSYYKYAFGGDPAPGQVKHLKVQYRMDGKAGEVTFPENARIVLPVPK